MEKFPQPPPDRRLNRKSSQPNIPKEKESNNIDEIEYYSETISNMDLIKQKNIEDMRKQLENFKILSEKKMFLNVSYNNININFMNIVLFGPSGSGKSSFIRTLFKSIYNTKSLPPDVIDKLIIKNSYENEGTLCFQRMILKEQFEDKSTGIRICDTRGHLLMSKEEKEQFKLIVEGKVKDSVQVVQNTYRNPFLLWEFWKNDENLFDPKILIKEPTSINDLPHCVLLVFDGSSEDIINPDEVEFYRDIVSMSLTRGYSDIHIILTRVDILEEMAYKKGNKENVQNLIHSSKDMQIEKVIECLGVKRSNVHFIENYLSEKFENSIQIDYHVLKALHEMISSAEQFLLLYYNRNTSCFSKCGI